MRQRRAFTMQTFGKRGEKMQDDIRCGSIWFTERNRYGAWVIHGIIGTRQYYYYTKKEAMSRYRCEVLEKRVVLQNSVIYRQK